MKMNFVKTRGLSVWAALLLCATAYAGELPFPLLKDVLAAAKEVTAERYPDADYVVIDNLIAAKYNADGTDTSVDDEYVIALTESGRRHLSTASVWYSASYGSARIECAEIVKKDGRVVPVDVAANSRETIDTGQMGSNIYDRNSKYISLSVPGVEVGDIRHLRVRRSETKTRMPNAWSDYNTFEASCPILKTTYMVSAPEKLPLINRVLRDEIANTVSYSSSKRKDGGVDHVWRVSNVPRYFSEPSMPDAYTVVQRLLVSTLPDWESVSRWYAGLCEKPLADITPEMREKTKELIAGAKSDEEKIRAVFAFVSQQIRYMGVTTEDVAPGYEPHPVGVTFKNRYGVCRDKAALLAAMLRLAGFEAHPVLIMVGPKRDPEVPSLAFNHAITGVRGKDGNYMLMDCTNESTKDLMPAYLGNCSYLVANPKGESLKVSPVYPVDKQMLNALTKGDLDENGNGMFSTCLSFHGINDTVYRGYFLKLNSQKRRAFFETLVRRSCPGAELLSLKLTPEDLQNTDESLKVEIDYKVPEFPVRGEKLDTVSIPWFTDSIGYANFVIGNTGLKTRKYPLVTEVACGTEEVFVLSPGRALGKIAELPPVRDLDRGNIEYRLNIDDRGDKLVASRLFKVKAPEYSPAEYAMLKHSLEFIESSDKLRALFSPKSGTESADVEILRDENVISVKSESEWEESVLLKKRILTYAGKKKESEIKLAWNPAWQELELVHATVSNLNGRVFAAGKDEINEMDANWVRSAPRYPAEKLLVVNLPAVEVGSVIEVKYRMKNVNRPFFSLLNSFSLFAPVSDSSLEVKFPNRMDLRYRLYNGSGVEFNCVTGKTDTVLKWVCRKAAPVKQESGLPGWHRFQPVVCLSAGDWRAYAKMLAGEFDKKSSGAKEAARYAKEIVKGIRGKRERTMAISREVMRTIRLCGTSFTSLPLSALSEPDRTLADRYGNHADRALLLCAMLKAAGVKSEILLASADDTGFADAERASREIPQFGYFYKPIVRVKLDGETLYLNEGTRFNEPGTSNSELAYALSLDGKVGNVEVDAGKSDSQEWDCVIELDEFGKAQISVEKRISGAAVGSFRQLYKEMLPEIRRRRLLEMAGAYGNGAEPVGELFTDTDSYPAVMRFKVSVKDFAVIQGRRMSMKLPAELLSSVFSLRDDRRQNPLYVATTGKSSYSVKIVFPEKYRNWAMVPASFDWVLPCGLGEVKSEVFRSQDAKGRLVLSVRRSDTRLGGEVAPVMYPALLEYNRRMKHASSEIIMVEQ